MDAAQRFFAQALDVAGHAPAQVTTDGHDAYPRAIRETLGSGVRHRTSRYKNNKIEQDHRGVKHGCVRSETMKMADRWGGRPEMGLTVGHAAANSVMTTAQRS